MSRVSEKTPWYATDKGPEQDTDGLIVVVAVKQPEDVEVFAMETTSAVRTWMEKAWLRLTLTNEKMEAVLVTSLKKEDTVKVKVVEHTVVSKPAIKYLRLIIYTKLSSKEN